MQSIKPDPSGFLAKLLNTSLYSTYWVISLMDHSLYFKQEMLIQGSRIFHTCNCLKFLFSWYFWYAEVGHGWPVVLGGQAHWTVGLVATLISISSIIAADTFAFLGGRVSFSLIDICRLRNTFLSKWLFHTILVELHKLLLYFKTYIVWILYVASSTYLVSSSLCMLMSY